MTNSFEIQCHWLDNGHGDEAEKVTFAEISINAGAKCATEVEDIFSRIVQSAAPLSALYLAQWFAVNWWRLLWEPEANSYSWRASHKVGNAGGGYVWPNLSFSSDWETILIKSCPTERWEAEPIRYLNQFDIPVSISAFAEGVDKFMSETIERLSNFTKTQSDLAEFWNEVMDERNNDEISERRTLEACMGYDPEEAPANLLDELHAGIDRYGKEAIQEVAAASGTQALSHIHELM